MIKEIEFEQTLMDSLTKCTYRKDEDVFVNDYSCFTCKHFRGFELDKNIEKELSEIPLGDYSIYTKKRKGKVFCEFNEEEYDSRRSK